MKPVYEFEKDIVLGNFIRGRQFFEQVLEGDYFITANIKEKELDAFNKAVEASKISGELLDEVIRQFVEKKTGLVRQNYIVDLEQFSDGLVKARPKGDTAEQVEILMNSVRDGDFDIDFTNAHKKWQEEYPDEARNLGENGNTEIEIDAFKDSFEKVRIYSEGEEIFFEFQKKIESEYTENIRMMKKAAESMNVVLKELDENPLEGEVKDLTAMFAVATLRWLREKYNPTEKRGEYSAGYYKSYDDEIESQDYDSENKVYRVRFALSKNMGIMENICKRLDEEQKQEFLEKLMC